MDCFYAPDFDAQKPWFKQHAREGMLVGVLTTQGNIRGIALDRIDGLNPAQGRVYLQNHGAFYYSGKNCFHPKGQTYMWCPTREALLCGAFGLSQIGFDVLAGPAAAHNLLQEVLAMYPETTEEGFTHEVRKAIDKRRRSQLPLSRRQASSGRVSAFSTDLFKINITK